MGCLVNLIKIFLGLILIVIMLIVGYKLILHTLKYNFGVQNCQLDLTNFA